MAGGGNISVGIGGFLGLGSNIFGYFLNLAHTLKIFSISQIRFNGFVLE